VTIVLERAESNFPALDRIDDPRGGAVAWALLMASALLIIGIIVALIWLW
jgi:hypothetical protein